MVRSGYPQKQAVAAALSKAKYAVGGKTKPQIKAQKLDFDGVKREARDSDFNRFSGMAVINPSDIESLIPEKSYTPLKKDSGRNLRVDTLNIKAIEKPTVRVRSQVSEDGTIRPQRKPVVPFARGGIVNAVNQGSGLLASTGSGRKDILPRDVEPGSYVIPADVVAALGDGNTLAGGKVLDALI